MASVDIGGFGFSALLTSFPLYPMGVNLTSFPDDQDPFNIKELQVADSAMGLNGDFVYWRNANPIELTISIIPNSLDDIALSYILEQDRVSKLKSQAATTKNVINIVCKYPNSKIVTFTNGILISGSPDSTVQSSGRIGTKSYTFRFENKV